MILSLRPKKPEKMMNPKLSQESFCWILVILVLSQIQVCICQPDTLYETCSQPFRCANRGDMKYPFYGNNRPVSCGYPGFELDCQKDVPIISMNSISYRVLDIENSTHSLKVAREDFLTTTCPEPLHNTTLNFTLFSFSSISDDRNISLNYGCSLLSSQPQPQPQPQPSQGSFFIPFNCGPYGWSMVSTPEAAVGLRSTLGCSSNIFVPVNQTAASIISTTTPGSPITVSEEALRSGFWIQWLANNSKCQVCEESGGVCGSNQDSESFACNSSEGGKGTSGLFTLEKVLIGMAIAVAVIVSATFVIVYFKRKCPLKRLRNGLNQETNPDVENFLRNNEYLAPKRYKYSKIKKITKSFTDKLGQGGYGSVYKGMLPNGQIVAVKLLAETKSNGEDFINEVASISKTSHVNIVNLLGFCYERNGSALVYEFMPNKSLDKFISTNGSLNTDCQLDLETLFKIAVGVARGLEYLHKGCNARIVHFDIKPQNILLDEEFCPKISDFGLAKLCKKKQSVLSIAGTRGTIGYIAPEVFSRNFGGVSHKSDVYSYGMMVLEMAGARNITGIGSIQSSENYFPDKIYEQVIIQENQNLDDIASGEEVEAARKMFLVGFWCIQTVPSDRPSMSKVVDMLKGTLQSIQIPPKPYLFNPPKLGQGFSSSASGNLEIEISIED